MIVIRDNTSLLTTYFSIGIIEKLNKRSQFYDQRKILEILPFLDSNDILHQNQLNSYADWVITGLDYNNICLILEYLNQYDVGDISDFSFMN